MLQRVTRPGEVSINGVRFPIRGRIQTRLASEYPQKQITGTGEITSDSHPWASVHTWNDWRGGIGVDRMIVGDDDDRSWYSTCETRFRNHLMLPPLVTATAAPAGGQIFAISEHGSNVYGIFGVDLQSYNNATDSWGSQLQASGTTLHLFNVTLGGNEYLLASRNTTYEYSTDPTSSWNTSTKDVDYFAVWDDRLWGLSRSGQLWYTYTPGQDEIDDALLPESSLSGLCLLVERNAARNPVLYCYTTNGLYAHDAANSRWIKQEITLGGQHGPPSTTTQTSPCAVWRGAVYFGSGADILEYRVTGDTATLRTISPNIDDGLPKEFEGTISYLAASERDLIVGVSPNTGAKNSVLAWNGRGWRVLWEGTGANAMVAMYVSGQYSLYRVYFADVNSDNDGVRFINLPQTASNPKYINGYTFAASATHKTPWFRPQGGEVNLIALECVVDTNDCSADETVTVAYAVDYDEGTSDANYTTLGTITSDGRTVFTFPDNGISENVGKEFRSIRFKVSLARGSTNTNSPDMTSIALVYRKKLRTRWMHSMELDFTNHYGLLSPAALRAAFVSAVESNTLVEVSFRDDDGNTRNRYCDLIGPFGEEDTGWKEEGYMQCTAVEMLGAA